MGDAVAGTALLLIAAMDKLQRAAVAVAVHLRTVGAAVNNNRTLCSARAMPNGMPYFKPGNTITMRP